MRPPRLARTILALVSFSLLAAAALGAQGAAARSDATARRALLVRGADSVRGLPFFPPNAIAALSGAYALDSPAAAASPPPSGQPEAKLWYSRESLVFGPAWRRAGLSIGGLPGEVAYSLARGSGLVLALKADKYTLFFEFPSGEDPRSRAFAQAFVSKFQVFFENAANDAELSFPAYVDY